MCRVKLFSFIALLHFGTSDMHADIYGITSCYCLLRHLHKLLLSLLCAYNTNPPDKTLLRNQEAVVPDLVK